jgi:hypothetical protein
MTFRQVLLASCALVISATAATAQIPSYVPTDGLVGWWPFNGNANDESGNGNNGVVYLAGLTDDRFSSPNAAFIFNNGPDKITVPNSNDLQLTNSFTISCWIKTLPNTYGTGNEYYNILSKWGSSGDASYQLAINPSGNVFFSTHSNSNSTELVSNSILSFDSWYQLLYTQQNNSGKLYVNGVLEAESENMNIPMIMNNYVLFGSNEVPLGYYPSSLAFEGKIDDIAIYNRALTPQEIQNLYNGSTETTDTGNGVAPLPQGIPYQAAARDAQGQSLVNAAVNVRFTLHEGAADGAASYAETHALTTNSVGLFNTVFGNGTPEQSAFDSINWAATTKFLQVEIDLGEGYVDMGTTQLLSVPYALRSDEAARVKNAGLPIFSNNAAALAGGLVAGEMYRTAAGVLMVAY